MNNNNSTLTCSSSSDLPDFSPSNSDDLSHQFFQTTSFQGQDLSKKYGQMILNPRKKRSKLIKIDNSVASTSSNVVVAKPKYCSRKPDPSAPKITRPCSECGKRFWSVKALFGHMRCHPERQWRGINPPPNFRRSSTSDHHHCIDTLPQASPMTEEDQQAAYCLLMLANVPPQPCSVDSDQTTTDPTGVITNTVGNQGFSDSDIKDYQGVFGCGDSELPYVDHGAGPSGVSNYKFECSSCKKVFGSHQALGGHRASHKNVKGCFAINKNDGATEEDYNSIGNHDNRNVNNMACVDDQDKLLMGLVHRCSICLRVFSSGQALGGHKRCHWEKADDPSSLPLGGGGTNEFATKEAGCLDLNWPAPVEHMIIRHPP